MNRQQLQQQQLQQQQPIQPQQLSQQQQLQQQQRLQQLNQKPNLYVKQQMPQLDQQQQQQQPYGQNPPHGAIDQPYQQQPQQQQQQFQQGLPLKAPQLIDQQQPKPAIPQQGQILQGTTQTTPNINRNTVLPQQLQAVKQNIIPQSQPGSSSRIYFRKILDNQIIQSKEQKSLAQKQGKIIEETKWRSLIQRKLQEFHQDSLKQITQTKQLQIDDWKKLCNLPAEELLPQILEMTKYHKQKTLEIQEKINNYKEKFRFLLEYGQKNLSADCQEQEQLPQPSSLNDSYETILEEAKAEFDRNQKDQQMQQDGMIIPGQGYNQQGQDYNQQGRQMGEFPDGYLGEGNQQGNYPGQMGVGEVMQVEDQFQSNQYL